MAATCYYVRSVCSCSRAAPRNEGVAGGGFVGRDRDASSAPRSFRGRRLRQRLRAGDQSSALEVLGLPPQQYSKSELREAYIEKMKQIHPDVSVTMSEEEATDAAKALNIAYEEALAFVGQPGSLGGPSQAFIPMDEFDRTVGDPCLVFVNPFACNADPMLWREVQEVARESADPVEALMMRGVRVDPSALLYVTHEQLQVLYDHLAAMSDLWLDMEAAAWFLQDMVSRARRANARQQR